MNTAQILLAAIVLIAFEGFMIKGLNLLVDINRFIKYFNLNDIPTVEFSKKEGWEGTLENIYLSFYFIIQAIWWIIRGSGCFLAIMFQMIYTFINISMEYPVLWIANIPVLLLLVYAVVNAIRILGSSVGGGGD